MNRADTHYDHDASKQLAFELFDRFGHLREQFKNHPERNGTGAWGSELDSGQFLVIHHVQCNKEFRGMGLGRAITRGLITKALLYHNTKNRADESQVKKTSSDDANARWLTDLQVVNVPAHKLHCFVIPSRMPKDEVFGGSMENLARQSTLADFVLATSQMEKKAVSKSESFWRSLGFRRVGVSLCFAASFDPQHPSRSIAAANDSKDLMLAEEHFPFPQMFQIIETADQDKPAKRHEFSLQNLKVKHPLLYIVITVPDIQCVKQLIKLLAKNRRQWEKWTAVQHHGNNILHLACLQRKPRTVKWLIEKIDINGSLSQGRNLIGFTPLEQLNSELELNRTLNESILNDDLTSAYSYGEPVLDIAFNYRKGYLVPVADDFNGFTNDTAECPLSILQILNPTEDQRLQLKYGCTCGSCVGGILSPKMKAAVTHALSFALSTLRENISNAYLWQKASGKTFICQDVTKMLFRSIDLRTAWKTSYEVVQECLSENVLPTSENLVLQFYNSDDSSRQ